MNNNDYEKRLRNVLKQEELADLSQFNRAAWFAPTTPFAKKTSKLLSMVDLTGAFQVGEDTITVPGELRVFIAPEPPPYNGFLPLSALHKQRRVKAAQ